MISADNIGSLAYYYAMIEYLSAIDARPKNTYYRLIKEKPKKKKIKHLRLLGQHSKFFENKMTEDGRLTNSEIRRELARLSGEENS